MRKVLLVLVLCACQPWPAVTAGYDEERARAIVWERLGSDEMPPRVQWMAEPFKLADLGCCAEGNYWPSEHRLQVVWRGKISSSAYAHEMIHAWHWVTLGIVDNAHERPEWDALTIELNSLLAAEGL